MRNICLQDVMEIERHHFDLISNNSCRFRLFSILILFEGTYTFWQLTCVNLQDRLFLVFIKNYRCVRFQKLFELKLLIIASYGRRRLIVDYRVCQDGVFFRIMLLLISNVDHLIINNCLLCEFFEALGGRCCPSLHNILL